MTVKPNVASRAGRLARPWRAAIVLWAAVQALPAVAAPVTSVQVHRAGGQLELPVTGRWLRLQPGDRDLRVPAPDGAGRHRYWLEGHDAGWIEPAPGEPRLYQQVRPGRHRLRRQVMDEHGAWSPARDLELLVEPVWWRTPAAVFSAGLGLLALTGWLALWHRARRARRHALLLSRERQALAEQHSEAKSRFLATLGHELRTPMTGVLGMAELLEGSSLEPRQRDQVASIQRAGAHLLRLINDALDLARIEAGHLRLDSAAFELRPLLEEVAALLEPLAAAKSLGFTLRCDATSPVALQGDATRLRQILFNLGHNAIKFCERGEVTLRVAARQPHGLVLEIQDTGPGLEAGQQARLFHRFERGAGHRRDGSGLGLAISQELAVAMGGSISVRSVPGEGACFRVELPLPEAQAAIPVAAVPVISPHCRRVLLVEDEPLVAEVVVGLLQRAGHQATHAPQALAALTALDSEAYDLVLLDLDLPGIDGVTLARLIRARGLVVPMIALTARSDAEAEPAARAAGMCGFLRKPVTGEMLAGALGAVPVATA